MEQPAGQRAAPAHRPYGVTADVAELIRHIGIIGIAGVLLGLIVGGVGGRVLMRIAAVVAPDRVTGAATENGNVIGEITVGGTIELVIFVGILFGGIGAVAYVISERWLSWTGPLCPLAFGLLILAIGSPAALDPDNLDFLLVGNYELIVAMFVALFLLYGIALPLLVSALDGWLPKVNPARPLVSVVVYLTLVGLGGPFALGLVLFAIVENYLTGIFLLGLGFATALYWVVKYSHLIALYRPAATHEFPLALLLLVGKPWPTLGRLLGYGALIGAATTGTLQTWGAIADIRAGDFF